MLLEPSLIPDSHHRVDLLFFFPLQAVRDDSARQHPQQILHRHEHHRPARPHHAGVPQPLHPAVRLRPGRHFLRDPGLPHRPPAAGRRLLLHPEILPDGVQVSEATRSGRMSLCNQSRRFHRGRRGRVLCVLTAFYNLRRSLHSINTHKWQREGFKQLIYDSADLKSNSRTSQYSK